MAYLTNKEGSSPSINILLIIHKKSIKFSLYTFQLVPRAGIEPARLAALVFETNASTNSAIWATFQNCERKDTFIFKIHKPLLIL